MFNLRSILTFFLGALSLLVVEVVAVETAVADAEAEAAEVEAQLGTFGSLGASLDRLLLGLFLGAR